MPLRQHPQDRRLVLTMYFGEALAAQGSDRDRAGVVRVVLARLPPRQHPNPRRSSHSHSRRTRRGHHPAAGRLLARAAAVRLAVRDDRIGAQESRLFVRSGHIGITYGLTASVSCGTHSVGCMWHGHRPHHDTRPVMGYVLYRGGFSFGDGYGSGRPLPFEVHGDQTNDCEKRRQCNCSHQGVIE